MSTRAIKTTAHKTGWCPVCRKRSTKTKVFGKSGEEWMREMNPGTTIREMGIYAANRVQWQIENWKPDFTHDYCRVIDEDE